LFVSLRQPVGLGDQSSQKLQPPTNLNPKHHMRLPLLFLSATLTLGALSGCNGPDVTRAEFDKVRMLMSYDEVVSTFGSEPDETQVARGAKICNWKNEDGSFAFVIFENNQVKNLQFFDPKQILGNH
jgi:hypothetical protein